MSALTCALSTAQAAPLPFNQATITKLQGDVSFGEINANQTTKRIAVVADVVRANNFITTESQSRTELKYEDGSIVRIGQNTVFSFEANSRTLSLEKGSFVFFIPKGSGGATIKTAALTAAITGTIGKVSANTIAILEGVVVLQPSGRRVEAGSFARLNQDGSISIAKFDPATTYDGRLMNFNGPLPDFDERQLAAALPPLSNLQNRNSLDRVQSAPSSLDRLFPVKPLPTPTPVAKPVATPLPATPKPTPPPPPPPINP